jgi:hypothetical protein
VNSHPQKNPKVSEVLRWIERETGRKLSFEQLQLLVEEMRGFQIVSDRIQIYF